MRSGVIKPFKLILFLSVLLLKGSVSFAQVDPFAPTPSSPPPLPPSPLLPTGMEFIEIPSGSFQMGSPTSEEGRDDYEAQHTVIIDGFEMMTTEVTQGMWEEVMEESIYDLRDSVDPDWSLQGSGQLYPVYFVTWYDCQAFVERMNEIDPYHTYSLPSEAQWEYACRAGSNTRFYWGDNDTESIMGRYCWYNENSNGSAHPVAQKEPNAWGLFDLSGNVWEFCLDNAAQYELCPSDGSAYFGSDERRVVRGGGYSDAAEACRSALRGFYGPDSRHSGIGFRLVRNPRSADGFEQSTSLIGQICPVCGEEYSSVSDLSNHIVNNHTRFVSISDVIYDFQTQLKWIVGPDRDMTWNAALEWVDGLGGFWRLPTLDELKSLQDGGICKEDWGPFENSGIRVWTRNVIVSDGVEYGMSYFGHQLPELWSNHIVPDGGIRVFATMSFDAISQTEAQPIERSPLTASILRGMEYASIPSGSFLMGSPSSENDRDNDEEQHRVTIESFDIMTTEVTQGMWEEVMGFNPSSFKYGEDYPVENVSWVDCREFIDRLNELDPNNTYRLPTEAEWEYACRAGSTTRFYWGNSASESVIDSYCWYRENSNGSTHPVARKEPNAWGLYDMIGNIWEFCEDRYASDYDDCPTDGSAFNGSGDSRVARGGSWFFNPSVCRSADRGELPENNSNNQGLLGFRLVRY